MAITYTKEKVLNLLTEMSEENFKVFSERLMGKEVKMLGVRLPLLRKLSKQIAKEDGQTYLEETEFVHKMTDLKSTEGKTFANADNPYMEEIMLYGMVIGQMKEPIEILFPYIERYVALIDNWSTCDSFCSGLKQTKQQMGEMWDYLQSYLCSNKEYHIRFAVVMFINYYISEEYIDKLLKTFDEIHHEGYYVKMAVAWALSICLMKYWDKTIAYMESEDNHLDDFTYIKALQKGRESLCLTAEQKQYLKELKGKRK